MPANEFYDSTGVPSTNSAGESSAVRSEFNLIQDAFDKLPTMAGAGLEFVTVNAGGSALTTKNSSEARDYLDVYSKSETQAIADGIVTVPAGSIIPFIGGYFTNRVNGGFTSVLGNTAAELNALFNDDGFYVCDGDACFVADSPIFAGVSRYLPNLTDDRFLCGGTVAGVIGGDNTMDHDHDFSHTHTIPSHYHTTAAMSLTLAQMPRHRHYRSDMDPGWSECEAGSGNVVADNHTGGYTDYQGSGSPHSHGNTGTKALTSNAASTSTTTNQSYSENRPQFLACFYLMKVA